MTEQKMVSLMELDKMSMDEAQRLPFGARDALLDQVLADSRRSLGHKIARQSGLFSDYFEEDMSRMVKLRAVRIRCSGFIPVNERGDVPSQDPRDQFALVFENIKQAVIKMDTSLDRVTNMMIFLKDMGRWEQMNQVYRDYFKSQPTRATLGIADLNMNYQIEVANVIVLRVAR